MKFFPKEARLTRERRLRRQKRARGGIFGRSSRPRLAVHRSGRHVSAQLIDDEKSRTLAAVSDLEKGVNFEGTKTQRAARVGGILAHRALKRGIKRVVFDRRSFRYHGRIKALAEEARREGLVF